jgi:transcriptional regulator with XRE-family HTH domain
LQDVQRITEGEFKAAVLGAYERGERSLSVPRLHRLAEFYAVPVTQVLPPDEGAALSSAPGIGVTIDLNKLESLSGNDAVIFERFLRSIQMQRQDFNGRVLSIRRDDLRMLAALLDQTEERFSDRLADLGVSDEA